MNDWNIITQSIDNSKIKRFNYKKILGESLTAFVTKFKILGYTSADIKETIFQLPSVQNFLIHNPSIKQDFIKNVNISVSSRFAEQNTLERFKNEI